MNTTKLANWLATKERDYKEGVSIFVGLKIDPDKNNFLLTEDPSSMHEQILHKKLVKYARVHKIKPQKNVMSIEVGSKGNASTKTNAPGNKKKDSTGVSGRLKIDSNPTVRYEDLSDEMQGLYNECGVLSGEMKTLVAELKFIRGIEVKKERRGEIAHLIVERRKKYKANWAAVNAWYANRQNKTPEQIAVEEALANEKQNRADLNYIRRNYLNPSSKQAIELMKRMERLDKNKVSYEELVKSLKNKSE